MIGGGTGPLQRAGLALGFGRMWGARVQKVHVEPGEFWGMDNGAWGDYRDGRKFDPSRWLRNVDRAHAAGVPSMAVLPDVIGGAPGESLALSLKWLQSGYLPAWPWYLVIQNGIEEAEVAPCTDQLAGLFLGGDDALKKQADQWCVFAHSQGLRFHYGRCSTQDRIRQARRIGADSMDSTQGLWSRREWEKWSSWATGDQFAFWDGQPEGLR